MDGYTTSTYGEGFAEVYDRWFAYEGTASTVEMLAGARWRRTGAGAGCWHRAPRGALGHAGVSRSRRWMHPSRCSTSCAAKPLPTPITLCLGDMAVIPVDEPARFELVVVAVNTFFLLTTPHEQRSCFERVAELLTPGGRFVVEAFVPVDPPPTSGVETRTVELDRVILTAFRCDPDDQTVDGQHVELSGSGIRLRPWRLRYASPDELDQLATRAGLALEARHGGWNDEPFDDTSSTHVSVYRKP